MELPKCRSAYQYNFLLKLSWIIGICNIYGQSWQRKIYLLFLIIIHILICLFHILGFYLGLDEFPMILKVASQVSVISLTISCLAIIIKHEFLSPKKFVQIFCIFLYYEKQIEQNHLEINRSRQRTILLQGVIFLVIIFTMLAEAYTWISNVGIQNYKYYFCRNIQILFATICTALQIVIISELCDKFKSIGITLERAFLIKKRKNCMMERSLHIIKEQILEVRKLSKIHSTLCDLIDLLTDLYGVNLLFDVLSSIGFCVFYAAMIIQFCLINLNVDSPFYITYLKGTSIMWLLVLFVSIQFFD